MRRTTVLFLALAAACGDGSGGSVGSREDAADQALKAMKEYEGILASITDRKTSEAAKPKLEAIAKRFDAIAKSVEGLGPPDEGQHRATEEKMRPGIESLSKTVQDYMMRLLDNPEIGQPIDQPFAAAQNGILRLRGTLGG
jgi:hypothetical protein